MTPNAAKILLIEDDTRVVAVLERLNPALPPEAAVDECLAVQTLNTP